MNLYADRFGNDIAETNFDPKRGIKIEIEVIDENTTYGQTFVKISGIDEPILVTQGLPLRLKIYQEPD